MKNVHFSFIIGLIILLIGCDNSEDAPRLPSANRTVLVYMVADNSLSNFASLDIEEMIEGMKNVDVSSCNLCLYVDDRSTPVLYHFTKNAKGTVIKDIISTYDEQDSTDAGVMSSIVKRVFDTYPASSYGLVYWSHGEGWKPYPGTSTRWIGQDTGNGDKGMNISALASVLDKAPHLDFLLFDACFMQSVEVAYELRTYADYFLASPTEIPAPGAPYEELVPAMFLSENYARKIGEAYVSTYIENFNENLPLGSTYGYMLGDIWVAGASISVIKSSELDNLAAMTNQVLPTENVNHNFLRRDVFTYDKRFNPMYYDMVGMMRYLVTDDAAYNSWKSAYDKTVIYWGTTRTNYSDRGGVFLMDNTYGVSHYVPGASIADNSAYRSTAWYKDAGLGKLDW